MIHSERVRRQKAFNLPAEKYFYKPGFFLGLLIHSFGIDLYIVWIHIPPIMVTMPRFLILPYKSILIYEPWFSWINPKSKAEVSSLL